MDGWIQDGRYALRSILNAKRFAAIVIHDTLARDSRSRTL